MNNSNSQIHHLNKTQITPEAFNGKDQKIRSKLRMRFPLKDFAFLQRTAIVATSVYR